MGIVIASVGLVAGPDNARQVGDCHIHQAELGVIRDLFLSIKCCAAVGVHASQIDKITRLDEHAAGATGRVYVVGDFDAKENAFSVVEMPKKA